MLELAAWPFVWVVCFALGVLAARGDVRLAAWPFAWAACFSLGVLAVHGDEILFWLTPRPDRIAGAIERVVDGDTLEVDGYRVRLWGVDAPRGKARRLEVEAALEELVADRPLICQVVDWQPATKRFKRARAIARCSIGDQDLGRLLLDRGLVEVNVKTGRKVYGPTTD